MNGIVIAVIIIVIIFIILIFVTGNTEYFESELYSDNYRNGYGRYLPYICDLYFSTRQYFNWNEWFENHDSLPPFIYKDGSYYMGEQYQQEYPYLYHNGVASQGIKKGFSYPAETNCISQIKSMGNLYNKMIASLNLQSSKNVLNQIIQSSRGLPYNEEQYQAYGSERKAYVRKEQQEQQQQQLLLQNNEYSEDEPLGVGSSSDVVSMPQVIN